MVRLSFYGVLSVIVFSIFSLLARFLLPFSDEPDWVVRAQSLLVTNHDYWSPYIIFSPLLSDFSIDSAGCTELSQRLSMWNFIPPGCIEDSWQSLTRFFLTLFVMMPVFLVIIFKAQSFSIFKRLGFRLSMEEWFLRVDTLSVSIIFPSFIYHLGLLAEEQFFLVVSLFVFLFWGWWRVILFLLFFLFFIDIGNALVVSSFVVLLCFLSLFLGRVKDFNLFILFYGFVFLSFSFFLGYEFVFYISGLEWLPPFFTEKLNAMLDLLLLGGYVDKYPVILRPVITFFSFVFMTAHGVKVVVLYPVYFLLLMYIFFLVIKSNDERSCLLLVSSIILTLFFVFVFPNYSLAKYYMFIFPFIISVFVRKFGVSGVFYFAKLSSLTVFFHLLLYRI